MTASAVLSLCDSALLLMEEDTLSDSADLASPSNSTERIFANHFDNTIKAALARYDWRAITTRGALTEGSAPAFEYTKSFTLEDKVLSIVEVWLDGVIHFPANNYLYRLEGRSLLTNATAVNLVYTWYPLLADYADAAAYDAGFEAYIGDWSPWLREYAAMALAMGTCRAITGLETQRKKFADELEERFAQATLEDERGSGDSVSAYGNELWAVRQGLIE